MPADFVLRGGLLVDGTGNTPEQTDIAITGERISAISTHIADLGIDSNTREVDISGLVAAPGFIDIHTHYDAQVFWDPYLTPSCYHGVTSVIAGNCGFSLAPVRATHHELMAETLQGVEDMNAATLAAGVPWDFESFPEYLNSVERHGVALNFGAYVGHTALRLYTLGDAAYERSATTAEIQQMADLLVDAMEAGACGFATSFAVTHRGAKGKPVPSRLADMEEFKTLAKAAGSTHRGVLAIAPGQPAGIKDLYDLQPEANIPFTYTALLTSPSGKWRDLMKLNRQKWNEDVQVWPQVSPRPGTFQMTMAEPFALNPNAEFGELVGASTQVRTKAYQDTDWRQRATQAFETQAAMRPNWEKIQIDESNSHPEIIGIPVSQVAAKRGCDPLDVLLDTALEDNLATRVRFIFANDDLEGVAELLCEPHCTIGLSDAGAHVGQLCDAMQATDFLGRWVRDGELMPLEAAVRKLTGKQADLFNLSGRGYVREGAWADLAVFDFETIGPGPTRRVRDFPADEERLNADSPVGMEHVFVNGTPVCGELATNKQTNQAIQQQRSQSNSQASRQPSQQESKLFPGKILKPQPRK